MASSDERTTGSSAGAGGVSSVESSPLAIFDRASRRIVAVEGGGTAIEPGTRLDDGEDDGPILRVLPGSASETRYAEPVEVSAPGIDEDGERTLDLEDAIETDDR